MLQRKSFYPFIHSLNKKVLKIGVFWFYVQSIGLIYVHHMLLKPFSKSHRHLNFFLKFLFAPRRLADLSWP